jgi:hypothetical protein
VLRYLDPPPPEPPFKAGVWPGLPSEPLPPPADVIVEKTESDPEVAVPGVLAPVPPAPTVIGKAVAVTVTLFGAFG